MNMCQRPKRASSISTDQIEKVEDADTKVCVNALNGLLPFLQKWLPIDYIK